MRYHALFTVGVALWVVGGVRAYQDILVHPGRRVWVATCLGIWVVWGAYSLARASTKFLAREVVVVGPEDLAITREWFGVLRASRAFRKSQVTGLRRGEEMLPAPGSLGAGWYSASGETAVDGVRFEYEGRPFGFACGASRGDVAAALDALEKAMRDPPVRPSC